MLEKLAKWYLSRSLRKQNIDNIEIVIRSDGWTYYKRNKEREKSMQKTIDKIKQDRRKQY